jgi:hypothetical protein
VLDGDFGSQGLSFCCHRGPSLLRDFAGKGVVSVVPGAETANYLELMKELSESSQLKSRPANAWFSLKAAMNVLFFSFVKHGGMRSSAICYAAIWSLQKFNWQSRQRAVEGRQQSIGPGLILHGETTLWRWWIALYKAVTALRGVALKYNPTVRIRVYSTHTSVDFAAGCSLYFCSSYPKIRIYCQVREYLTNTDELPISNLPSSNCQSLVSM